MTDRLANLLTDRLSDWRTDWLTGWQTDSLANWLFDWLTTGLTDRLTNWLTDWLTDQHTRAKEVGVRTEAGHSADVVSTVHGYDSQSSEGCRALHFRVDGDEGRGRGTQHRVSHRLRPTVQLVRPVRTLRLSVTHWAGGETLSTVQARKC